MNYGCDELRSCIAQARSFSTVGEHLPRHPKVKGSRTGNGREKSIIAPATDAKLMLDFATFVFD
jgi:hypothetical protein